MHADAPSTAAAPVWAGVDVGTQSLRVLLVSADGSVVGRGAGALTSHRVDGRHEQDPAQWWEVLGAAFRQALATVAATAVRGVAICGTSGTFLLADAGGPRTAAIMYDDGRAAAVTPDVSAAGAALWASLGYAMQPSWALPKLVHLRRHGPPDLRTDIAAGRVRFLHCPDHLAERLTGGSVAADWSHALKTGYDLDQLAWPAAVLGKLDLPAAVLPAVVRPGTVIGEVSAAGAAHTGLSAGTPVYAGMTDGCAAQIAAGALAPGSWNTVLGTTLVLKGVTVSRLGDPAGAVYSHRHPDAGWLPGGASSIGAGVLERRYPSGDRDALDLAAARHEPAGGICYPLPGRGERFPFVAPDAVGFTVGEFAGAADEYAAVLQGVAFVERLAFASLRRLGADVSGPVCVTGGATRSRYWTGLRATVLDRQLHLPATPEPAFGMAVLAAAGSTGGGLAATAARMVRVGEVVEPQPGGGERFTDAYHRFVDALAARGYVDPGMARYAKETP